MFLVSAMVILLSFQPISLAHAILISEVDFRTNSLELAITFIHQILFSLVRAIFMHQIMIIFALAVV